MTKRIKTKKNCIAWMIFIGVSFLLCGCKGQKKDYIINVSYDPTRELYEEYNQLFARHWLEKTGDEIEIIQSHGGSGKQALEVCGAHIGLDLLRI